VERPLFDGLDAARGIRVEDGALHPA